MDKKSVSASLLIIYLGILFSVIGVCFSSFVYTKNKTEVTSVALSNSAGVQIFKDEKFTKTINKLSLSDMDVGLKPATGEVDAETQIPSTITDQGTSEGYYASVFVKADADFKLVVKDIKIETDKNETEAKEQRKNIFIAVKDTKNAIKSLEEDEFELVKFSDVSETQKITFLIWLGSLASDSLVGAKISFTIEFASV